MARELLTAKGLASKLEEARAEAARKNTRVRIPDGDNLNLIVRANGGASWVLDYRLRGQRKPYTIGSWPTTTLAAARQRANEVREKVARGIDPLEEKRVDLERQVVERAEAQSQQDTVRELMEDWLAKHKGSRVYVGNIRAAFIKDVLPAIGGLPPQDVTREHVVKILRSMEGREALVMLRRLRMWLRHMFEFGCDDEGRPKLSAIPVPTGHLRSFMAPSYGNFAAIKDADRVPSLMRAIRGYGSTIVRHALLLSAYVFQRPTEIREAVWEEFDLEGGVWRIPAARMKRGREHLVPLAPQVVQLLRSHQGVVGRRGLLFPGRKYNQAISENTLETALHGLGFKGEHTPHGFRAMAHTILAEVLEVDERFIEKQLSHEEENKVKRAYNRAEFWEQRVEMMRRWADWLDAQV